MSHEAVYTITEIKNIPVSTLKKAIEKVADHLDLQLRITRNHQENGFTAVLKAPDITLTVTWQNGIPVVSGRRCPEFYRISSLLIDTCIATVVEEAMLEMGYTTESLAPNEVFGTTGFNP